MRGCQSCSELKARVEEMRDELAAWQSYQTVDTRWPDVSKWLGLSSHQAAKILSHLLDREGATVSRTMLAEQIGYEGDQVSNLIPVLICRINKRLGERSLPLVRNKWGHGYVVERADAAKIRAAMESSECG